MKRVRKVNNIDDIIEEEDEGIRLEFTKQGEQKTDNSNLKLIKSSHHKEESFHLPKERNNGEFVRSASAAVFKNVNEDRQRKISTPVKSNTPKTDSFINQLSSTSSLYTVSSRLNRLRPPKRSPSTSSFQYVSTPYHGSTLTFQPEEFTSHLSLKSIASSINPMTVCSKQKKEGKNKFLDLSLLKDPVYLVILISNSTNAIGYTNFIILLVSVKMVDCINSSYMKGLIIKFILSFLI